MNTQDPHCPNEETQEEHTMKKTTQGTVKMNDQFQINAAVNYWNEQKSWGRILSELDFPYRTETAMNGTRIIVHDRHDQRTIHGVAGEYSTGPQARLVNLSEHMKGLLNTEESSVDRQEFFCRYIFHGDWGEMLKKEIIPFYERHLRDLAADESIEDQ